MTELVMILAGLAPAVLLFLYIWKKDPVHEPLRLLLKGVFWGALICIPVGVVEMMISNILFDGGEPTNLIGTTMQAFFVAALPEEAFKLQAFWLLVRKNPYFDEHIDGIVYAVCVGLGFAAFENIGYLFGNQDSWQSVAVVRALMAVPGHYAFAVLMGYYYSLYHFVNRSTRNYVSILLMPVLFHGIYDALLMTSIVSTAIGAVCFCIAVWFCIRMHKFCQRRVIAQLDRDKYQTVIDQWTV
jgi:RsiW-degrading membrane proteinase PrsW (M82 family)